MDTNQMYQMISSIQLWSRVKSAVKLVDDAHPSIYRSLSLARLRRSLTGLPC